MTGEKLTISSREGAIAFQAKVLCMIAGIAPVDPTDGSPNWWMFQKEAGEIVDGIRNRFPPTETTT